MDPVTLAIFGANMGMQLSGQAQQRKQAEIQNMIRAAEIEASPWTKMAPQTPIKFSDMSAGAALAKGGLDAWSQMQAMEQADKQRAFQQAQMENMNAQTSALNSMFKGGNASAPAGGSPWTIMGKNNSLTFKDQYGV